MTTKITIPNLSYHIIKRQTHIPLFRSTKMKIIYTVKIHIFSVPSKGRLPHAKVKIGCVYPRNTDAIFFCDSIQYGTQVVDIPFFDILVVKGTRYVRSIYGWIEGDVLPVLTFKFFIVFNFRRFVSVEKTKDNE